MTEPPPTASVSDPVPAGLTVVVGILTYRRPGLLGELLPAVSVQARAFAESTGGKVSVLVVDNDPERSAEPVCRGLPGVRYAAEPTPGIAAARHRCLAEAGAADLLQFIDDDELPFPDWLRLMVSTWERRGRPGAVAGAVLPHYEREPSPWLLAGRFFERRLPPTGTELSAAPSGNLLLDLAQVRALGIQFDRRLGLRGGEDTLFTRELAARGARIVFCREAPIHDLVPAERMTREWVLNRARHHGATAAFLRLRALPPGPRRMAYRLVVALGGLGRVGYGLGRAAYGLVRGELAHRALGLKMVNRGLGMAQEAVSGRRPEYARGNDA